AAARVGSSRPRAPAASLSPLPGRSRPAGFRPAAAYPDPPRRRLRTAADLPPVSPPAVHRRIPQCSLGAHEMRPALRPLLLTLILAAAPSIVAADTLTRITDLVAGDDDGLNGLAAAVVGNHLYFVGWVPA